MLRFLIRRRLALERYLRLYNPFYIVSVQSGSILVPAKAAAIWKPQA
jgi:hypothetical protein